MVAAAVAFVFAMQLGLMAGFYYAWSVSAMWGFANTRPEVYVEAMQRINEAVRNGWFAASFFGAIAVGALCMALVGAPARLWMIAAFAAYVVSFAITMLVHVPMNVAMADWSAAAPPADWRAFLDAWTRWNHVRGAVATLAFGLALAGLTAQARAG